MKINEHNEAERERYLFYNGKLWRKLRNTFIKQNPWCAICDKNGKVTLATVVDHIKPRVYFPELSYIKSNMQSLCAECHGRKTVEEMKQRKKDSKPLDRELNYILNIINQQPEKK